MLQQTQAQRVVGPYLRFLDRFPTPSACGAARLGQVVEAWAGLGYNRRARSLHEAARVVVDRHGGVVPSGLEALLALPGVGAYTARAVRVFAFEHHEAVVDVNVARVLSRAVAGVPLTPGAAQAMADALVPDAGAWDWNQALMEIGAVVCTARAPRCGCCALSRLCAWTNATDNAPDPAPGRVAPDPIRGLGPPRSRPSGRRAATGPGTSGAPARRLRLARGSRARPARRRRARGRRPGQARAGQCPGPTLTRRPRGAAPVRA